MVYKTIECKVPEDFKNDYFLNVSPEETKSIINIGCDIFKKIKDRLIENYKNGSKNKMEIDKIVRHETDKLLEQYNKDKHELKLKYSNLEGEKQALEKEIKYLQPQLINLENNLHNKNIIMQRKLDEQEEYLKNKYNNETEELQNTIKKYQEKFETISNENRDREDKIRKDYEEKIDNIREKYESINSIYNNSSKKGKQAEEQVNDVLLSSFPTAVITDTHKETAKGDFNIFINNVNILYENKCYDSRNVPGKEILKFIRDVEINSDIDCGILASQTRGIANKQNLFIEFTKNNKPVIYLHNTLQNTDNIKLGVNVLISIVKNNIVLGDSKIEKIKDMLNDIHKLESSNEIHRKNIEPSIRAYKDSKETILNLKNKFINLLDEFDDNSTQIIIDDTQKVVDNSNQIIIDDTQKVVDNSNQIIIDDTQDISDDIIENNNNDNTLNESPNLILNIEPSKTKKTKKTKKKKKDDKKNTKPTSYNNWLYRSGNYTKIRDEIMAENPSDSNADINILTQKRAGKIWKTKTKEEKAKWINIE